ncbi:MAG: prepilin peptidase, partial [Planctomycetales bacterium]|nr:prepilin peptidase [Planctomycetales bacterium]
MPQPVWSPLLTLAGILQLVLDDGRWLAVIWIGMVGSAIGSFLNVVVYRWPAGMSIVHPPSRCPKCESPIRSRDNLPVLGWLMLKGRCRDCAAPISIRYPLVEAIVGVIFMIIASSLLQGHRTVYYNVTPDLYLLGVLVRSLILATLLMSIVLNRIDGNQVPTPLIWFGVVVGMVAACFLPTDQNSLQEMLESYQAPESLVSITRLLAAGFGGIVGFAYGKLLRCFQGQSKHSWSVPFLKHGRDPLPIFGLFLGIYAGEVAALAILTTSVVIALLVARSNRLPLTTLAGLVTLVLLVFWPRGTPTEDFYVRLLWLIAAAVGLLLVRWIDYRTVSIPTTSPTPNPAAQTKGVFVDNEASENLQAIIEHPSYRLAHKDSEFIGSAELRPLRMQL